jgi:hypothetical protein
VATPAASQFPPIGPSQPLSCLSLCFLRAPRNYEASPIWEGAKSPLPTIAIFFCFAKFSFGTAYLWSWQLNGQSLVITARILVSKLSESGNTTFYALPLLVKLLNLHWYSFSFRMQRTVRRYTSWQDCF